MVYQQSGGVAYMYDSRWYAVRLVTYDIRARIKLQLYIGCKMHCIQFLVAEL